MNGDNFATVSPPKHVNNWEKGTDPKTIYWAQDLAFQLPGGGVSYFGKGRERQTRSLKIKMDQHERVWRK